MGTHNLDGIGGGCHEALANFWEFGGPFGPLGSLPAIRQRRPNAANLR